MELGCQFWVCDGSCLCHWKTIAHLRSREVPLLASSVSKRLLELELAWTASAFARRSASREACAESHSASRVMGASSVPPLTKREAMAAVNEGRVGVEL